MRKRVDSNYLMLAYDAAKTVKVDWLASCVSGDAHLILFNRKKKSFINTKSFINLINLLENCIYYIFRINLS